MTSQSRRRSGALASAAAAILPLMPLACRKASPAELVPGDTAGWRATTSVRLDYPVPGHEERYREIRMSPAGFAYLESGSGSPGGRLDFPDGTVIVKDIYATSRPAPGEPPVMVTAMVKAPGDPDARGGWLWVVKDLASGGEKRMVGDFCVRCHANANERHRYGTGNPEGAYADYVFYVPGR